MPLVNMIDLLKDGKKNKYAVLATNLLTYEMLCGGIKAAEENNSPVILQLAPVQFSVAPLEILGPMMVYLAKKAKVPVAVHLDHGFDFDQIKQAIDIGFTSVMIDASAYPYEENIRITKEVVDYAHLKGVYVEAELGHVGNEGEGNEEEEIHQHEDFLTRPEQAKDFVAQTNCDALAVAIGNAHGLYKSAPKLDFERLKAINELVDIPLVLHGGSGTSETDFQKAVNNGITKVNLASSIHKAYVESIVSSTSTNFIETINQLKDATNKVVKDHMNILGSIQKASNFL